MPVSKNDVKHWANRYVCLSKIGNGAFGTVYKVRDNTIPEGHGTTKVLKEIQVTNMDLDEIDECAREGKLLSKLSNPGIVQFFDSFCYGEFYCIITEFCEGGDLNQLIVNTKKEGARLNEKRILRWFIELMQALNYIHKRKILHRDLKTRNVFFKNDYIKIGDFGISRILNFTMDMASTFVGTPFYMSPEVLKHDGYNTVSDVWSAGVILYEMCALKHAYDAKGIMAVMYKIVEGPCPTIPDYYSKDLQSVLEKVMIKDPANRPTASEVLQIEYIQKAMRDTFLDLNAVIDLDETLIKNQTKDIQTFITEPNGVKILKDSTIEDTLTPKQKMQLRKKEKADHEAEEKSKIASKIYNETRKKTIQSKQKSTADSLPFSNRLNNPVTLHSSYDENFERMKRNYDSTRASGSNTIIPIRQQKSESDEYEKNISDTYPGYQDLKQSSLEKRPESAIVIPSSELNKTFTMPSRNKSQLYDTETLNMNYVEPSTYRVTTFNADFDSKPVIAEEIFYEDDFSRSSDDYQSDDNTPDKNDEIINDTTFSKFQDDEDKDPFSIKIKNQKIKNMEKQCLDKISVDVYKKAMKFLDEHRDRENYDAKLRQICKSDNVALLVDQLHFLKKSDNRIY